MDENIYEKARRCFEERVVAVWHQVQTEYKFVEQLCFSTEISSDGKSDVIELDQRITYMCNSLLAILDNLGNGVTVIKVHLSASQKSFDCAEGYTVMYHSLIGLVIQCFDFIVQNCSSHKTQDEDAILKKIHCCFEAVSIFTTTQYTLFKELANTGHNGFFPLSLFFSFFFSVIFFDCIMTLTCIVCAFLYF